MRSELLDRRLGPFENLATNPKLKRCVAGSTVFKRNLATNPIFARAVSGTDVVRRNLAVNPKLSADASLWSAFGTNASTAYSTRVAVTTPEAGISWAYERSGFGMQSASRVVYQIDGLTVGATYSVSALIRTVLTDGASSAQLIVATSASAGTGNLHIYGISTGGVYSRTSGVFVAQASTMYLQLRKAGPTSELQNTIGMTGILVEQRPSPLPYFDGDTPDALGFTYEWEGTAGASTSVIKTASVEVRRNLFPTPDGSSSRQNWTSGSLASSEVLADTSLALRRRVTALSDISGGTAFAGGFTSTNNVATTPGEVLTISVSARSTVGCTIRLRILWLDATGSVLSTQDGFTVPLTPGIVGKLTAVAVTAPASAAFVTVRLANGGPTTVTGTVIDYGDILVERTSVVLPFFDGSTTPDADMMPAWAGAENASESVLRGVRADGVAGTARCLAYIAADGTGVRGMVTEVGFSPRIQMETVSLAAGGAVQVVATFVSAVGSLPGVLRALETGGDGTVVTNSPITAGTTDRILIDVTAGGLAKAELGVNNTAPIGTTFTWAAYAMVEGGAYSGPIFHGDTDPDDTGIVYEWEGTEHDSASVMKVGVIEVRRNLCLDPLGATGTNWEGGSGATSSSIPGIPFPTAWSVTINNPLINARLGPRFSTIVGRSYVASAWIYVESALWSARIATVGVAPTQLGPSLAAGWQWVSIPFVATDTSHTLLIRHNADETGNQVIAMTGVIVEERTVAHVASDRFDGYTSPDGDLSAAWTGPENASASVLYGTSVPTLEGYFPSRSTRFHSFSDGSGRAIRIDSLGGNTGFIVPGVTVAGENRTLTALVEVTAPFGGSLAIFNSSGSWTGAITVPASPNKQSLRVTGRVPATRTSAGFALFTNLGSIGQDIFKIHRALIVEGIYTGPYFDGDDDRVVWRGTPHASTSVGYPIPV